MLVYVSGPYSAATEEERLANVTRAIDAGIDLMLKGHIPYIPHLSHYVEARANERHLKWIPGSSENHSMWLTLDQAWVFVCDALLYLGPSKGADMELAWAKEQNKKIFYSVEEVPNAR